MVRALKHAALAEAGSKPVTGTLQHRHRHRARAHLGSTAPRPGGKAVGHHAKPDSCRPLNTRVTLRSRVDGRILFSRENAGLSVHIRTDEAPTALLARLDALRARPPSGTSFSRSVRYPAKPTASCSTRAAAAVRRKPVSERNETAATNSGKEFSLPGRIRGDREVHHRRRARRAPGQHW